MTICVFFVSPNFPNIGFVDVYGGTLRHIKNWEYMKVYKGIYKYIKVYEAI